MKKIKYVLLPLLALSMVACGGGSTASSSSNPSSSSSSKEAATFTVTFETNGGTAVASVSAKDGSTVEEPTSPTKSAYIFTGWYLESACTNKAAFPLKITANITLFAGWKECREYYLEARDATVGDKSAGFAYDSALSIKVGYSALSYSGSGSYTGKSQYNPSSAASYYEAITYTGLLFSNHTTHEYLKDGSLVNIKVKEDGSVSSYSAKDTPAGYKYDFSSFSKALFSYTKDDIKTVELVSGGQYEIKSKYGFSALAKLALSNVNNKYVEMVLGTLPETESTYHNYVTFNKDGYIDTYSYSFTVTVSGIKVEFAYSLNFTSANKAVAITLPSFNGLYITESEVTSKLGEVKTALDTYRTKAKSAYDFTVKTGIDFSRDNEINATIKGKALRAVTNGVTYFNNTIEVDSDFKNADLYKDNGVEDYKRTRGKISDGTVYDVENPLVGFKKYTEVTSSTTLDDCYYLIGDSLLTYAGFSCVFASTKDGVTTYTLPLSGSASTKTIFDLVNESTRLDPTLAKHVNVMGEYDISTLASDNATIEIDVSSTGLKEVRIELDGKIKTAFAGSVSFSTATLADYSLELTLSTTTDADNYTVPTDKKDIVQ